jgi:hypothetical protein
LEVSSSPYIIHRQPPLLSYVIRRGGAISPARARFEIVYLWRLFSLSFFFLSKRDSRTCSASATIHTDTRVSPSRMSVLHTQKKTFFFIFFALDLFSVAVSTCFTSGRKEKKKSPKKKQKNKRTSIGVCIGKEMRPQTASITNDF